MIIDESYPEVPFIPAMDIVAATRAHRTELDPIDPNDEGMADYSGELLSDVDFGAFSHSALVRIADEVCLQMHLLVKSFTHRGARSAPRTMRRSRGRFAPSS